MIAGVVVAMPLSMAARRAPALPSPTVRQAVATGRIEGNVLLSTTLTNRRPRFRIYSDPGATSRPAAVKPSDEMRNVVIYVEKAPLSASSSAAPSARATIEQREQFVPHILPVVRGTTVDFPNADDEFHNVFSLSSAATFDLGRFPKGASKAHTFERAGTVQIFCHIHADMSAVVLVLTNPLFAVPSDAGKYVIEGVPAGEYTVVGWHERVKPITQTIRVVAGETVRLDFNIPVPPSSDAGPNGH